MKNILANLFLDTELNFKKLEFQTKKSDQLNRRCHRVVMQSLEAWGQNTL